MRNFSSRLIAETAVRGYNERSFVAFESSQSKSLPIEAAIS